MSEKATIEPPLPKTLRKYGISEKEWTRLYKKQKGLCPICGIALLKRTNIDHQHVKGWKNFPSKKRKMYIRGITCWTCNRLIIGRGVTIERLKRAVIYLENFDALIKSRV